MKKLDIHRDMPEPSLEDMQKHMNFEEVLNRASSTSAIPKKGISKAWIVGGAAVVTVTVATILMVSQNNIVTDSNYQNVAMEGETIEKITNIEPQESDIMIVSATDDKEPQEKIEAEEISYDDYYLPNEHVVTIEYYEPLLVSSIAFPFDESFGLKEQWQEFPELSIYENLSFQPIDKAQQSMLNVHWEKAEFNKDENGQYFLILHKSGQEVLCPVIPVFEKEDYLNALDAYQEHQP